MSRSIIKAYEDGTLKQLQEQERAEMLARKPKPSAHVLDAITDAIDDYEDDGLEKWCDECHNTGEIDCHCGGDLCVCRNNGSMPCPKCGEY